MNREIHLLHPTGARPLRAGPFAAFGEAAGIADVRGVLKDLKKRVVAEARTLQRPPHWIVYFAGVDVLPGTYLLEVSETGVSIPLLVSREVQVEGSGVTGIRIDFPAEGETVGPGQLVAYGSTDRNLRLGGRLSIPTEAGSVVRTAESLQGPPETPRWVIAFADVPASTGADARLEVFNTGGDQAVRDALRILGRD